MENIFQSIANVINPKIAELEMQLLDVEIQIKKHTPNDSYFNALSRSFPLGMVGGSGRNTRQLNKRREASINRSIEASKVLTPLYSKRDNLTRQIEDIKSGKAEKREINAITLRIAKADYWRSLKVGDELNLGNSNGNPIIAKKARLSVTTTNGVKWTASQVIGREAAKHI